MLVRVKEPHTEIRLTGAGASRVYEDLCALYRDQVELDEDEDLVDVQDTEWYRAQKTQMTPGKRLRIYRENKSLSLAMLSELTGITKGNLSTMEHGKRAIGKLVAQKLAGALGCDYRSLL